MAMLKSIFQNFERRGGPEHGAERVARLRGEMARRGLAGVLVPRADEYQNEYVPPCAERLLWLSGFSGSAGLAAVLNHEAAIFVDGRYTLQVREECDLATFSPQHVAEAPPEAWLRARLRPGEKLGYDPMLHTQGAVERLERALKDVGAELVALDENLVDAIWSDRPPAPLGAVSLYPQRYAGEAASAKLARIAAALEGCDALVVSDPHSVAWAFNIRGDDVAHTPLPLVSAVVKASGEATLYVDARKLDETARQALSGLARLAEPSQLLSDLQQFAADKARVRLDAATAPARYAQVLRAGGRAEIGPDPVALMKACKNATELAGTRKAHVRDGAALVGFLAWFDKAAMGKITEIDAVAALEGFRRATGKLKDVSFPSIAGAGPNAAIPHYHVSEASNQIVTPGLFLIDSGGQYVDGTTDITRTIAVGKPTREMRERFTQVLKGHIAVARAVFPKGTSGAQLDALARQALWSAGQDFDHGTGHGVGCYLSVHEGPQRLSKLGTTTLAPGMILSNEPGFYKSGEYGIRIENLLVVEPRAIKGAAREMLGFETISFAPIDLRLVEPRLMTREEVAWLDAYHARVRRKLLTRVSEKERAWLKKATRPIE